MRRSAEIAWETSDEVHAHYDQSQADGRRALHPRAAHPRRDRGRMVADGMTETEILSAYPDLEREDLAEALRYAADALRERELPLVSS